MNAEYERQLIGAWLLGFNKEHIEEFDSFIVYPEVLKALKKTSDFSEISRMTKILPTELVSMTREYVPTFYESAYRMLKESKIKQMVHAIATAPGELKHKINDIVAEMDKLTGAKIKQPTGISDKYREEIKQRQIEQPLKYGLPTLDYVTGGLRRKELTVISARPSIGKTALALQVAFNIAIKGHKVLFFPLEMSGEQLMERIICRETSINHESLKSPKNLTREDKEELETYLSAYEETVEGDLAIVEGVALLSEIRRHIVHYRPEIVFIDQLSQLKEKLKFNSLREQFTYMTNTLKAMTMELDMPIILMAQLNRGVQDKEPTLADLKESGSIEEDSDNIVMIHQLEEEALDRTLVQVIVRKQRNGARDVKIDAVYLNKKFIFREVEKRKL